MSESTPGGFSKARKPADLPVVQTTKFEFVINLRLQPTELLTPPIISHLAHAAMWRVLD
jgi:hypothetical protein